jgi:hypothetical protein
MYNRQFQQIRKLVSMLSYSSCCVRLHWRCIAAAKRTIIWHANKIGVARQRARTLQQASVELSLDDCKTYCYQKRSSDDFSCCYRALWPLLSAAIALLSSAVLYCFKNPIYPLPSTVCETLTAQTPQADCRLNNYLLYLNEVTIASNSF